MSNNTLALVISLGLILLFALGCFTGFVSGRNDTRKAAIKSGAAQWTIDPETGDKSFDWLAPADRKTKD